jgi:hypothetical protein
MTHRPSISEALRFLGNNAASVAESLKALGIKGARIFPSYCVLAQYLRKLGYSKVEVGAHAVFVEKKKVFDLPEYLYEFRNRFDQGFYPYLLEG